MVKFSKPRLAVSFTELQESNSWIATLEKILPRCWIFRNATLRYGCTQTPSCVCTACVHFAFLDKYSNQTPIPFASKTLTQTLKSLSNKVDTSAPDWWFAVKSKWQMWVLDKTFLWTSNLIHAVHSEKKSI